MRNKLATILSLGFLFFCKNFSQAATGECWVGVDVKTTYILERQKALADYFLLGNSLLAGDDTVVLGKDADKMFEFSWFPIIGGVNAGYSLYFTKKFGLSLQGNFAQGNIAVFDINKEAYENALKKNSKGNNDKGISKNRYKISVVSAGGDLRLKYDLINSSLNFENYGRNSWKLDASLGFRSDWFFFKRESLLDEQNGNKEQEQENKVLTGDRINCWHPGVILGLSAIMPFNLGVAVDGCYYFRNIFTASEEVKAKDKKCIDNANRSNRGVVPNPKYGTPCSFLQVDLRFFYDFAPFINNHESPSEVDIEKW